MLYIFNLLKVRSSHLGTAETNPTRYYEVAGSIPGLAQWVKDLACRCGSDPTLLWLWCRQAATAPIRLLDWEPPYAVGEALEKAKRQK